VKNGLHPGQPYNIRQYMSYKIAWGWFRLPVFGAIG
jgi:hypothetical protein